MSAVDDRYLDADEHDDDEGQGDDRDRNRQGYDRRKRDKAQRDAEVAELRAKVEKYERAEKLAAAKGELNASGPLAAFLRTYDGEPTADAIKAAIAKDPDFKTLITFTPDPRDEAAAGQADAAAKLKAGDPIGQRAVERQVTPGVGRLEAAYDAASGKTKTT